MDNLIYKVLCIESPEKSLMSCHIILLSVVVYITNHSNETVYQSLQIVPLKIMSKGFKIFPV